jgi:hypothetical protein
MEREPGAWGYNCATLSLGDIKIQTSGPPGWGLDTGLMTMLCKKIWQNLLRKTMTQKCCFPMMMIITVTRHGGLGLIEWIGVSRYMPIFL